MILPRLSTSDPQPNGLENEILPSAPPPELRHTRSASVRSGRVTILHSPPLRMLEEAPYTEPPEEMQLSEQVPELPALDTSSLTSPRSESIEITGEATESRPAIGRRRTNGTPKRRTTTVLPSSPKEPPLRWPFARPTLTRAISSATACLTPVALVQGKEEEAEILDQIWYTYAREANQYDQRMIAAWNRSLEVSVISAGIFSAILTPFVVESYKLLQTVRDPPPTFFGTNGYAIRVNTAWFGSLMISLIAALLSIHFRQWVQGYGASEFFVGNADSAENLWRACRMRQYRYQNLQRFFIPELISLLPVLLYCALVLFAIGLIDFLWHLNKGIAIYISVLCGNTAAFHIITTIVPFFTTRSPFKTPLSNLLSNLWRGVWRKRFAVKGLLEEDEATDVEHRGPDLDQNGLEWLMRHTHSEETFQDALRAKWVHIRVVQKNKSSDSPV